MTGKLPAVATIHARQAIDALISGIKSGDSVAAAKLFDAGAVIVAGSAHAADEEELIRTLGHIGPHEIVTDAKVRKLVVGGNDDTVWVFADLAVTKLNQEPGKSRRQAPLQCA